MRGKAFRQISMLTSTTPEDLIPADHPIHRINAIVEPILAELSPTFDAMHAEGGRHSIPPERLLKGCLLIAFYSMRSERQPIAASFHPAPTNFANSREGLQTHRVPQVRSNEPMGRSEFPPSRGTVPTQGDPASPTSPAAVPAIEEHPHGPGGSRHYVHTESSPSTRSRRRRRRRRRRRLRALCGRREHRAAVLGTARLHCPSGHRSLRDVGTGMVRPGRTVVRAVPWRWRGLQLQPHRQFRGSATRLLRSVRPHLPRPCVADGPSHLHRHLASRPSDHGAPGHLGADRPAGWAAGRSVGDGVELVEYHRLAHP